MAASTWAETGASGGSRTASSAPAWSDRATTSWRRLAHTTYTVDRTPCLYIRDITQYVTLSICIITTKLYCGSRCHGDLFCNCTVLLDPTKTYLTVFEGVISFPVTAARAWNALPSSVRSMPSLLQFRRDLKTALHVSVIVLFTTVSSCVTDRNF